MQLDEQSPARTSKPTKVWSARAHRQSSTLCRPPPAARRAPSRSVSSSAPPVAKSLPPPSSRREKPLSAFINPAAPPEIPLPSVSHLPSTPDTLHTHTTLDLCLSHIPSSTTTMARPKKVASSDEKTITQQLKTYLDNQEHVRTSCLPLGAYLATRHASQYSMHSCARTCHSSSPSSLLPRVAPVPYCTLSLMRPRCDQEHSQCDEAAALCKR